MKSMSELRVLVRIQETSSNKYNFRRMWCTLTQYYQSDVLTTSGAFAVILTKLQLSRVTLYLAGRRGATKSKAVSYVRPSLPEPAGPDSDDHTLPALIPCEPCDPVSLLSTGGGERSFRSAPRCEVETSKSTGIPASGL